MNPYASLLGISIAVIIAGAVTMYLIESPNEEAEIKTMLDAFWWTTSTIATVGYGDVVPVTDLGKTVAMFYMFFGIGIAGMFLSIIATRYYKKRVVPKEDQEITDAKKILDRIDELEKSIKEIRDSLK